MTIPTQNLSLALAFDPAALETAKVTAERDLGEFLAVQAIATPEQRALVAELLSSAAREADAVEAMRTSATKPLNQTKRTIDSWFKPTLDAYKRFREHGLNLLGAYDLAVAKREREAQAAALAAVQARDMPALAQALTTVNAPREASHGATTRLVWVAEVLDLAAVPEAFTRRVLDDAAIERHIAAAGVLEPAAVPGLKFTQVAAGGRVSR